MAFWRAASGPCKALVKHVPFLERHGQCGIPRLNYGAAWIACRLVEYKAASCDKTREAAIDGPQTIRTCRAMTITKLDLSGLKCPLPALKVRKALKSLTPGDRLEVRCTDPLAGIDIPHLVGVTGDRLEIIERGERDIVFHIEKSAPTLA
jgi:tRNA 2-thiouridine synthesizing protein A